MGLRTAFRLVRAGVHLLWGATIIVLAFPWVGAAVRRMLKGRWSAQLVGILGATIKVRAGEPAGNGFPTGLVVSNHVSWLDIFVINAVTPVAFVAKDEVRNWPLIGWLSARTETIFLERGSSAAAQRARAAMAAHLRHGVPVAVFPEGTTTGGERVLPFHGALFQGAIDSAATVSPLALRYIEAGTISRTPAYDGDITLWQSLVAIARSDGLTAEVDILPALPGADMNRRQLAAHCHAAIAHHLGRADTGFTATPAAWPTDHRASGRPGDPQVARPSNCRPTGNPNPAPASYPSA